MKLGLFVSLAAAVAAVALADQPPPWHRPVSRPKYLLVELVRAKSFFFDSLKTISSLLALQEDDKYISYGARGGDGGGGGAGPSAASRAFRQGSKLNAIDREK